MEISFRRPHREIRKQEIRKPKEKVIKCWEERFREYMDDGKIIHPGRIIRIRNNEIR